MKPEKPVESITKCHFARGGKQQQQFPAKRTGAFRGQLASIVTYWVIFHLCADLTTAPVLPKTPGSSTGFMVEAEHPKVEELQQDK